MPATSWTTQQKACKLSSNIKLTRRQIERLSVFLALQKNVESVTIEESRTSGIGPCHDATYHFQDNTWDFKEDISDVSNW